VSAAWTAGILEPEARAFLEAGETKGEREGVGIFHASPRDPVWEYVLSPGVAYASLAQTPQDVVLVGHSHVALSFGLANTTLATAAEGTEVALAGDRWLLNPGSVGQPRDGDPKAAWLFLDLEAKQASFRRIAYDIAKTQAEIRERGLPEALAVRLEHGV
jgi:diadenosine tetraphosphatase ApaH/serine/threonine PP2A family protein phosphatase